MAEVAKALESFRGKGPYNIIVGSVLNGETTVSLNPKSGIRFLNGKVVLFDQTGAQHEAMSLDDQIRFAENASYTRERTAAILKCKQKVAKLRCEASQYEDLINKARAGNLDGFILVDGDDHVSDEMVQAWIRALAAQKGVLDLEIATKTVEKRRIRDEMMAKAKEDEAKLQATLREIKYKYDRGLVGLSIIFIGFIFVSLAVLAMAIVWGEEMGDILDYLRSVVFDF